MDTIEKEILDATGLKHNHLVQYYDCEQQDNTFCIFSEFVSGSVQQVLRTAGKLEETVVKRYTKQLLAAVRSGAPNEGYAGGWDGARIVGPILKKYFEKKNRSDSATLSPFKVK